MILLLIKLHTCNPSVINQFWKIFLQLQVKCNAFLGARVCQHRKSKILNIQNSNIFQQFLSDLRTTKGWRSPDVPCWLLGSLIPLIQKPGLIDSPSGTWSFVDCVSKTQKFTHDKKPWIIKPSLFWCWNWLNFLSFIWQLQDFTELSEDFKGETPNLIKLPVLLVTCELDEWIPTKPTENLLNYVCGVWRAT